MPVTHLKSVHEDTVSLAGRELTIQALGGPGRQEVTMKELLGLHIKVETVVRLMGDFEKIVRAWA